MSINMFKMLADNIMQPLWIMDLEFKLVYANQEYIKIHSGKNNKDIYNIYYSELIEQYKSNCEEVIKTLEISTVRKYVNDIFMECTIIPILNDKNELEGLCGTYKEVLSLNKRQNKILNFLIDTFPGHIFYKNNKGKYLYANDKCINYYKEKGITELIGKSDEELENPDVMLNDKSKLKESKSFHEYINYINDNESHFETVEKEFFEDGEFLGTVGFSIDITEKVKNETILKELSYKDILTNTYNRTYFEKKCDEFSGNAENVGIIMGDVNGLKIVNDSLGHLEGDNLLRIISRILIDASKNDGLVFRMGGDEFIILVENASEDKCRKIIEYITSECKKCNHKLINISISLGYSITDGKKKDLQYVITEAEKYVYKGKLRKEKSIKDSIVDSTVERLNNRNIERFDHIERMIENAIYIGEKLKLDNTMMEELVLTSKLHDIGKIGVDEEILLKNNKLTKSELDIAQNHAEKGYRILKAADVLNNVSKSVLTHHERWDGKGYPLGLKSTDIPTVARIISVVDSYDVMISGSSYKGPMTEEEAIEELRKCSGTQFDPEIVEIFLEYLEKTKAAL